MFNDFYPGDPRKQRKGERRTPKSSVSSGTSRIKIRVFAVAVAVTAFVGLLIPLRPSVSEIENRELAEFPKLTFGSFISGEFFSGISTWYADTFPFRETFMKGANSLRSLFGIRGEQIIGPVESGDEIVTGTGTEDFNIIPVDPGTWTPVTTVSPESSGDPETIGAPETTLSPEDSADPPGTDESSDVQSGTEAPVTPEEPVTASPPETTAAPTSPPPETTGAPGTDPAPVDTGRPAGEGEKVGSLYVLGDTIYEFCGYSSSNTKRFADAMTRCAERLAGKADVYSLIAPKAWDFYLTAAQKKKLGCRDEKAMLDSAYSLMGAGVKKVPVYSYLDTKKDEYIFFRTDHHWTALGAYYSYQVFCTVKGVAPKPLSGWKTREFTGFLGSLYSEAKQPAAAAANPDVVQVWYPNSTNSMTYWESATKKTSYKVIWDVSTWNARSKYNTFIAGDQPFEEIHNPTLSDGSAVAVIKDSFGNAFVPFLVDDYQDVYVLDFRYFKKYYTKGLYSFVEERGIDDVIFLLNITNVNSGGGVSLVEAMVK
jgi:hypothetical protein